MFLSTLHTSIIFKATRHRSSNCRYSGHRWNLTEVPLVTDNWHIAVPSGCATFALILIMYLQRMLQAVRMSSRSFESHDRSTNPRTVLFWILLALIFCVVFPISYIALHFSIFHFHNFNFVGATAAPLSLYSMHINTTHAQLLAVWHLSKWPQHHTRPFVTLALSPNKHVSLCLCVCIFSTAVGVMQLTCVKCQPYDYRRPLALGCIKRRKRAVFDCWGKPKKTEV